MDRMDVRLAYQIAKQRKFKWCPLQPNLGVYIACTELHYKSLFYRLCDSKNINNSPLCNLSAVSDTTKWGDDVRQLYGEEGIPEYVQKLSSPLRYNYHTQEQRSEELLQGLTEVNVLGFGIDNYHLYFQSDSVYNAFERDVAMVNIFFGKSTVIG